MPGVAESRGLSRKSRPLTETRLVCLCRRPPHLEQPLEPPYTFVMLGKVGASKEVAARKQAYASRVGPRVSLYLRDAWQVGGDEETSCRRACRSNGDKRYER